MRLFAMILIVSCLGSIAVYAAESDRAALQYLANEIRQSQQQMHLIDGEIEKLSAEKDSFERDINAQRYNLAKTVHALYRLEQHPAYLTFLSSTGTIMDRYYAFRHHQNTRAVLRAMIENSRDQIDNAKSTIAKIEDYKYRQNLLALTVQASLDQLSNFAGNLPQSPLPDSFRVMIDDLKHEKTNLEEFIRTIVELPPIQNESGDISFILPVSGIITEKHDAAHTGITITSRPQSLVSAPAHGTIIYADSYKNLGPIVITRHHGGYVSIMRGFERLFVTVGQYVTQNSPVGILSVQNGVEKTNGAMFYYELRYNGHVINPLTSLSGL